MCEVHWHQYIRYLCSLPRLWGKYIVKATPKMLPAPDVNSTLDCRITDPDYVWLVWTQSITWSYEGSILVVTREARPD